MALRKRLEKWIAPRNSASMRWRDVLFGGGVFDGWVITDPHKTDTVIEPLSLSLFHPDPQDVLEVGMSGGAWSRSDSEFAGNVPITSSAAIPTCMSSL